MLSFNKMLVFGALGVLLIAGSSFAAEAECGDGPCLMPAHPELIKHVGPKKVAELNGRFS